MFFLMCVVTMLVLVLFCYLFFFFKQKTAYEMRISDWSSDVCSSDLAGRQGRPARQAVEPPSLPHAGRGARPDPGRHGDAASWRELVRTVRRRLRPIGRASCMERVCQYV